ncbi:MAG: hypothetical protein A3H95_05075 [Acidobacteria bacterium RIFCSPLOWO2_02_FULL_64_15]|nr:MAG: hypothetical protein A3H95_05075 [Acidobacteria bacterium RIFCSPLOWO2_02_FULL_64_15]
MADGTSPTTQSPSQPAAEPAPPLAPEAAARLTEFARAMKAAARAVVLYPPAHPAVTATLGRIAQITSAANLPQALTLRVLPDRLLVEDRAPDRPDAAIAELAALLHNHLIGELTIQTGGDTEGWRRFLTLLGRAPDVVRAEGGIARAWAAMAGRHIELREIDYSEVLKERAGESDLKWEELIARCLQGETFELSDDELKELLGSEGPDRLAHLVATLDQHAAAKGGGVGPRAAALIRMLRGIVDTVTKSQPEKVDALLRNAAAAVGSLTPEMLLGLLTEDAASAEGPTLMKAVVGRMSDGTIAKFVSTNVMADGSATDRLAQAFQSLVREDDQRQRLLKLAKDEVADSPLGQTEGFEQVWNHVAEKLLTSYSDASYVPAAYSRELSGARTQAIQVEAVSDDPPERLSAWIGTVATNAVRALDMTLLLDLLRIEEDDELWGELMTPVVSLVDDLLLVGDFDAAAELLNVIVRQAAPGGGKERRQHAMIAIDTLVAGPMLHHITSHLATIDEAQFDRVKSMCVSLGEVLVRPLAEALASEERGRARERLTKILIAFGAIGRRQVERLKGSPNAAVRRTAVYLLREFGGTDALPDLTELLNDNEAQVQGDAVRAIAKIGTERAYRELGQALVKGTTRSRETLMQALGALRDEQVTPLLSYLLRHISHRGALGPIYLRTVEALGTLRDPKGIALLKDVLYNKGEWWAPARTRALRDAAAAALSRIGTTEAIEVLEEAATAGSRGVRSAARDHLTAAKSSSRHRAGKGAA